MQNLTKKPNENGHENHPGNSGTTSNGGGASQITNAGDKETSKASASASSSSVSSDLKSVSVTMTSTPIVPSGQAGSSSGKSSEFDFSLSKSVNKSSAYDFNASDSFGPSDKSIPPMRKDSPAKVSVLF